jgi:hypothetical protein
MPYHRRRTWAVVPIESAEALAEKLIGHSWCSCNGWSLGSYLFLNDPRSPDGTFEVAVVKPPAEPGGPWWQIESVTFGWFQSEPFGRTAKVKARECIELYVYGAMDPGQPRSVAWKCERSRVETPEQHGTCWHCA